MDRSIHSEHIKSKPAYVSKISWPTPQATVKNTAIVVGWTAITAAIVFAADFISGAGFQMLIRLAA